MVAEPPVCFAEMQLGVLELLRRKFLRTVDTGDIFPRFGFHVIGGIFQTTEREDEVKIPLLGDIPLIGHFFRHKSKLQDKTELLVFLTPTVLDKP